MLSSSSFFALLLISFWNPHPSKVSCHEFVDAVSSVDIARIETLLSDDLMSAFAELARKRSSYLQEPTNLNKVLIPKKFQAQEPVILEGAKCRKRTRLSKEERALASSGNYRFFRLLENGENLMPKRDSIREVSFVQEGGEWKVWKIEPDFFERQKELTNQNKD